MKSPAGTDGQRAVGRYVSRVGNVAVRVACLMHSVVPSSPRSVCGRRLPDRCASPALQAEVQALLSEFEAFKSRLVKLRADQ